MNTTVSVATWKAILAIVIGSFVGALARQGLSLALDPIQSAHHELAMVVTALGGLGLGAAMSWAATASALSDEMRRVVITSLIAALGTFSAAAVLGPEGAPTVDTERVVYTAAVHIVIAIIACAIGLSLVRWLRDR